MGLFNDPYLQEELDRAQEDIKTLQNRLAENERMRLRDLAEAQRKYDKLQFDHELYNQRKELEWNYADSELIDKLNSEKAKLEQDNAVLTTRIEMMQKMIDIDSDILDVKDLVDSLIKKLPEVSIKGVTVNHSTK